MENREKGALDDAIVSRVIIYVQNYVSTMKDLFTNTIDEVKLLPDQLYSLGLPSQDLNVLFTACCSLFGLLITFTILYAFLRFFKWISLGSGSAHHGLVGKKTILQSTVPVTNSVRWFKQAWYDLMAARNDLEGQQLAPEWVCFKSQQALEKALKALLLASSSSESVLSTDDIYELAVMTGDSTLRVKVRAVQGILGPTNRMRYPDYFQPLMIPRNTYSLNDAINVYGITQSVMDLIRHKIKDYVEIDF